MPIITHCPKCQQPVTVPDGVAPQAEVRCPLCAVIYPLTEAMADLPPALIPVDAGAITGRTAESEATASPTVVSEPYHVPESSEAEAQPPGGQDAVPDVWKKVDAAPQIDTAAAGGGSPSSHAGRTPVDSEAPPGFGIEEIGESQKTHGPVAGSPTKHRRRRKKEKGAVRVLVEVFGGGVVGLTIGYYIACWAGLDVPRFPLPLLPHTMHWFERGAKPKNKVETPAVNKQETSNSRPPGQPRPQPRDAKTAAGRTR